MTGEERFLNSATRGLSKNARLAAQAELRSHLHERVQQLVLAGEPEEGARVQAIRELAPPRSSPAACAGANTFTRP